jgi:hypothetical protein
MAPECAFWSPINAKCFLAFSLEFWGWIDDNIGMKALLILLALCSPVLADGRSAIEAKDGKAKAAQYQDAIEVNIRPECRAKLAPIVAAIRYSENGGKGKEYGILHKRVKPTYRSQAGWCAATVQKNYDRWVKAGSKGDYITFLGKRYCPVGAENDPNGLNRHWISNVTHYTKKFSKKG